MSSIAVSDLQMPSGERIFDHRAFLEREPRARLLSVTIYGYNYIMAIETRYAVPEMDEPKIYLHSGTAFDLSKSSELHKETIELDYSEHIELISC